MSQTPTQPRLRSLNPPETSIPRSMLLVPNMKLRMKHHGLLLVDGLQQNTERIETKLK